MFLCTTQGFYKKWFTGDQITEAFFICKNFWNQCPDKVNVCGRHHRALCNSNTSIVCKAGLLKTDLINDLQSFSLGL